MEIALRFFKIITLSVLISYIPHLNILKCVEYRVDRYRHRCYRYKVRVDMKKQLEILLERLEDVENPSVAEEQYSIPRH